MILRIATTAISLALFLQCVEGVIVMNVSDVLNDHAMAIALVHQCTMLWLILLVMF